MYIKMEEAIIFPAWTQKYCEWIIFNISNKNNSFTSNINNAIHSINIY